MPAADVLRQIGPPRGVAATEGDLRSFWVRL
jgi:hypothetical protein